MVEIYSRYDDPTLVECDMCGWVGGASQRYSSWLSR